VLIQKAISQELGIEPTKKYWSNSPLHFLAINFAINRSSMENGIVLSASTNLLTFVMNTIHIEGGKQAADQQVNQLQVDAPLTICITYCE
jgi:hypothetical protein